MEWLYKRINYSFKILRSSQSEFSKIDKKELDSLLGDYIILLLICSLLAGGATFLLNFGRALYYDLFLGAEASYAGVLNYSVGIGVSVAFFYLFSGTFLFFLLSAILKALMPTYPYVRLIKVMIYSTTPLLLFGWIPLFGPSLIVWTFFLFIINKNL